MKMSKSERKAYNQGKRDGQQIGYFEGYAKGLHDGNPFNALMEAVSNFVKTIGENPEIMAEAMKQRAKSPEELEAELEAEDLEDKEIQDAMRKTYLGE